MWSVLPGGSPESSSHVVAVNRKEQSPARLAFIRRLLITSPPFLQRAPGETQLWTSVRTNLIQREGSEVARRVLLIGIRRDLVKLWRILLNHIGALMPHGLHCHQSYVGVRVS